MASDKGSLASDRETVTADEGTVVSDEETITTEEGTVASPPGETEVNYIANETRIVMIGKTGSGKSSTANTLLGMNWFQSMLSSVSITRKTSSKVMKYKGRYFLLIDTPGLFDTEIPNKVMKKEIMKCVALAAPGLHAVVLVTKIGRFTEEEKQNIIEFKKYFGEGLGRYLIIIFTGKDDLDADGTKLEKYLEGADKVLKQVVEECEHRCIAVNNRASDAEKEQFKDDLLALVDRTVKLNGGGCYTNDMLQQAEIFMKLEERRKLLELQEEKKTEREEEERKMKAKFELELAEVSKRAFEEQKKMTEKLRAVEERENERKQKAETERLRCKNPQRAKAVGKLHTENEISKLRKEAAKEKEKFEKEKVELQQKLHTDQMKLEREKERILKELKGLETVINHRKKEITQKMNEEKAQYKESLQCEARRQVRKGLEEDISLLGRFTNTVSKQFRWLKHALLH